MYAVLIGCHHVCRTLSLSQTYLGLLYFYVGHLVSLLCFLLLRRTVDLLSAIDGSRRAALPTLLFNTQYRHYYIG